MKQSITNQYELFKLLSMLNESLFFLADERIDRNIRKVMRDVFKELSKAVEALTACYYKKTDTVSFDKLEDCLSNFNSELYKLLPETGSAAVHLSNLAFGVKRTSNLLQKQWNLVKKEEDEIK